MSDTPPLYHSKMQSRAVVEGGSSTLWKDTHLFRWLKDEIPANVTRLQGSVGTYESDLELVAQYNGGVYIVSPLRRVWNWQFGRTYTLPEEKDFCPVTCVTKDRRIFADPGYIHAQNDGFHGKRVFKFLEEGGLANVAHALFVAHNARMHHRVNRFLGQQRMKP
jgi:hypothetical protein